MSVGFQFDDDAIRRVAYEAAACQRGAQLQHLLDEIHSAHAGEPIGAVRTALAAAGEQAGFPITDPHLAAWAAAIAEGRKIEVQVEVA